VAGGERLNGHPHVWASARPAPRGWRFVFAFSSCGSSVFCSRLRENEATLFEETDYIRSDRAQNVEGISKRELFENNVPARCCRRIQIIEEAVRHL